MDAKTLDELALKAEAAGDQEKAARYRRLAAAYRSSSKPTTPPTSPTGPVATPVPAAEGVAPTPFTPDYETLYKIPKKAGSADLPNLAMQAYEREMESGLKQRTQTIEATKAQAEKAKQKVLGIASTAEGAKYSPAGVPGAAIGGTPLLAPLAPGSRMIRGMPGYVLDETTGKPREASTIELLTEPFTRQTIYEGPAAEQRKADLLKQKESVYQQARAEGKTEDEARQRAEPLITGLATSVEPNRIVETRLMAGMRGLGMSEAVLGEWVFDTLPLFYEVDEKGNLQHPDEMGDRFAKWADDTLKEYLPSYANQPFILGTNRMVAPRPFQAIDRDAPTTLPDSGERTADYTNRALADVAMSVAKGRSMGDEFFSVKAYRDTLGENYGTGLTTALVGGFFIPNSPVPGLGTIADAAKIGEDLGRTVKAARAAEAAATLGKAAKAGEALTSPTQWAQAYKLSTAVNELSAATGGKPVSVTEALLSTGDVAKRGADIVAQEITAPTSLRVMANEGVNAEELVGAASNSRTGKHILKAAGIAEDTTGKLTPEQIKAIDTAAKEWRLGAEADALANAFVGPNSKALTPGVLKAPDATIRKVVGDLVGNAEDAISGTRYEQILEDLRRVTQAEGQVTPGQFDEALKQWKQLAKESGSMQLPAGNKYLRSAIAFVDQVENAAIKMHNPKAIDPLESGAAQALIYKAYRSPLAPAFRVSDELAKNIPYTEPHLYLNAALHRAVASGAEDVIRNVAPKDMVFVTDRLMVPRALVNNDSVETAGEYIAWLLPKEAYAVVDGTHTVSTSALNKALDTVDVVPESGFWKQAKETGFLKTLGDKSLASRGTVQLTPDEFAWVSDTLLERAWRQTLGSSEVRTPVFAGRQAEMAMRPSDTAGKVRKSFGDITNELADVVRTIDSQVRKAVMATTTIGGFKPQDVRVAEGTVVNGFLTDWRKTFQTDLTPAAVQKAMSDINNLVAPIPDAFRAEILADAKKATAAKLANPGEVGLNTTLLRRWGKVGDEAVAKLDEQVQLLASRGLPPELWDVTIKQRPTEAQLYAVVAYQLRGINEIEGTATTMQIGQRLASIGKMDAAQQANFIELTKKAFRDQAYMGEWSRILDNYFIGTLFGKEIDPNANQLRQDIRLSLGSFVRDAAGQQALEELRLAQARNAPSDELYKLHDIVTNAGVLPPTSSNFEAVVKRMKQSSEELGRRGAASYSLLNREWKTASFETLSAWAMGVDKTSIVNQQLKRMFDMNPAIRMDLLPTATARTSAFSDKLAMAKLDTAADVVESMAMFYKQITRKDLPKDLLDAARTEAKTPSGILGPLAAEREVPTMKYAATPGARKQQIRIGEQLARETAKAEKSGAYADSLQKALDTVKNQIDKLTAQKDSIVNFTRSPTAKAKAQQLWTEVDAAKAALKAAQDQADSDIAALRKAQAERKAYREAVKAPAIGPTAADVAAHQDKVDQLTSSLNAAQAQYDESVSILNTIAQYRAAISKARGNAKRVAQRRLDGFLIANGSAGNVDALIARHRYTKDAGDQLLSTMRAELEALKANPPKAGARAPLPPKGLSNKDMQGLLAQAKASRAETKRLTAVLSPLEAKKAAFIKIIESKITPIANELKKLADARYKIGIKLKDATTKAAASQASVSAPLVRSVVPFVERPVLVPVLADVDRYIDLRLRSLGVEERSQIMEDIVGRMISDGTLYPNMRNLRANTSVRTAGNRATLAAEVRGGIGRLFESKGPKADTALHKLVFTVAQEAKRLQVPQDKLVDVIVNAVDARMSDIASSGLVEDVRDVMRGYGFTTMHNVSEGTKTELLGGFLGIDLNSPQILGVGRDFVEAMKKLEIQAASGELVSKLERLQTRNIAATENYGQLAAYLTMEGLAFSKSMAQSGLLAAGTAIQMPLLPLIPNGRYLGVNILTNPLIMLSTVGAGRAGAAIEGAAQQLVDVVTRRPANIPMFIDVNGRPWLQTDLDAAYLRNNIATTTADMNMAADFFESLKTELRVTSRAEGLEQKSWWRSAMNQLDPNQSNIFGRFAVECDMTMRKAVFASALRDGVPEVQAAKLAREATLDYGNIPSEIKTYANRYILFAAFQIASTKAMLESLANDPGTFIRVARFQMREHQMAGDWYYGDDSNRVRAFSLPVKTGPETDNIPAYLAGPQNPILSSYWQTISVLGWLGELFGTAGIGPEPVDWTSRGIEGAMEAQINPPTQAALGMISTPGEGAIGRLVPDDWVAALKTYPALWTLLKVQCSIEEVPMAPQSEERRRPGTPTFEGTPGIQYQFTSKAGYRRWQLYMLAATQARLGRTTTDVEKTMIAAGAGPQGYNPKYRALANPFLYYVGATTPVRGVTPQEIQRRALQTAEREVR